MDENKLLEYGFEQFSVGTCVKNIVFAIEPVGKSFKDSIEKLDEKTKDWLTALLTEMSQKKKLELKSIRYSFSNIEDLGEIKKGQHRFLFFEANDTYVFFDHQIKKKDKFNSNELKQINQRKYGYIEKFNSLI